MTNSQAELEHINLQRKKHSAMNYAVSEEFSALLIQIPELISLKGGIVRDDIYRADPARKDAMTAIKIHRNNEALNKLDKVYEAIKAYRKAVGEVDLSEDDKKPSANY